MIYVDELKAYPGKKKKYCHMTADSIQELHEFAKAMGIKRCWYEISNSGLGHYDLNPENREKAIKGGAYVVSSRSFFKPFNCGRFR